MSFAVSILEQGLIYGILALGIYITYKILDFPDLTVDGSFPLGAAVTDPSGCICSRCGSRYLYRTDPCQMQGKRSAFRYHYDDSALDDQPSCGRNSQCTVVFPEDNL